MTGQKQRFENWNEQVDFKEWKAKISLQSQYYLKGQHSVYLFPETALWNFDVLRAQAGKLCNADFAVELKSYFLIKLETSGAVEKKQ